MSADNKKHLPIYADEAFFEDIKLLATQEDRSISYYIVQLAKQHIANNEKLLKTLRSQK